MAYQLGSPLKGVNGTVIFDGAGVTIIRKGLLARGTVGKGEKRIPLASITAVQWKPPGMMVSGFIQFTLSGGSERRSQFGKQTWDATDDENTVMVSKGQMEKEFLGLRSAVETALTDLHSPKVSAPEGSASPPALQLGIADELAKLASLRDADVLTQEEFQSHKRALLGSATATGSDVAAGTDMPAPMAPADWYSDPSGDKRLRYWDGAAWTDHVAD